MDPVLRAEATQGGGLGAGDTGCSEGTGSRQDIGGSSPRAVLYRPNITPGKYIFQGQNKPVCSGRGVLAVPWVPGGTWSEEVGVVAPLPKVTAI